MAWTRIGPVLSAVAILSVWILAPTVTAQSAGVQAPGTVESVGSNAVTLTGGQSFQVDEQTRVTILAPAAPADLAPGQFIAITATRGADGNLEASIVSRVAEGSNAAPGQRPIDGANIMTNATITEATLEAVTEAMLTVTFGDSAEQVRISKETRIEFQSRGSLADVVPGASVTGALNDDGLATTIRVHL